MGAHTLMVPKVKRAPVALAALRKVDVWEVLVYFGLSLVVLLAGVVLSEMTRWRW